MQVMLRVDERAVPPVSNGDEGLEAGNVQQCNHPLLSRIDHHIIGSQSPSRPSRQSCRDEGNAEGATFYGGASEKSAK